MESKLKKAARALALVAGASCVGISGPAQAQSNQDLKQKIDLLQQQIDLLKAQLDKVAQQQSAAPAAAAAPQASGGHDFLERKAGDGVTFFTRGGELSIYGNLDISADDSTKGIGGMTSGGASPVGNMGCMPDISTNLSYIGVRGFQSLGSFPATFVYQLETQIDVSAASGTSPSNSNTSDVVKGGLTSRNSFIGLASPQWGAFKIGKTDAPYKTSTASMNPFSGMWGDYAESWAIRAATTGSSSGPGLTTRSGTNRRASTASTSMRWWLRARTAPPTTATWRPGKAIVPEATFRAAAPFPSPATTAPTERPTASAAAIASARSMRPPR